MKAMKRKYPMTGPWLMPILRPTNRDLNRAPNQEQKNPDFMLIWDKG